MIILEPVDPCLHQTNRLHLVRVGSRCFVSYLSVLNGRGYFDDVERRMVVREDEADEVYLIRVEE